MLRPLVATAAVTAATVLLAGCGGNDTKSDSTPGGAGNPSATTSSTPPVASFDPPKAFVPVAAFGIKGNKDDFDAVMAGQTAAAWTPEGITGWNIAGQGEPWTYDPGFPQTTVGKDATALIAAKLDGKDVIAAAWLQSDKGNGTRKAKGQLTFRWIDATDGKKVAEVVVDLSTLLGPGEIGDNLVSEAYDATTGQIVVGVHPEEMTGAQKSGQVFAVYADPKTQKSSMIPRFEPAAVLNGVIAGVNGGEANGRGETTILIANATTGTITKQYPTNQQHLYGAGHGSKRAYMVGGTSRPDLSYNNVLYSVDIATGAVVSITSNITDEDLRFRCLGDRANAAVCTSNLGHHKEIVGIEETTGKKIWGYTDKSADRVVPDVTAAFHGTIYAQTDAQPVLLNAATGNDVPAPAPTPSDGASPAASATPSDSDTSSDSESSESASPGAANSWDLALYDDKQNSPASVSEFGGVYGQGSKDGDLPPALVLLKPTA